MNESEHWITMNDGVRLDASVWTPPGEPGAGGWPVLLFVHGHGDAGSKASMADQAIRQAERGYATVAYSVRGQGGSEGLSFHMGAREIFDLQDVIDWTLGELPVDARRLGVVGSSQGGWHAYMAAAHHPAVATVVAQNIFTDFADFAVANGCLSRWFFTRTMRRRIMTAGLQEMARRWAVEGEWERLREWLRPTSPRLFVGRIRCPIFVLHGWHDMGMPPNEVVDLFGRLRTPRKLYLGGGGHEAPDDPRAESVRQSLIERWLDHWLQGEETGIMDEPAIVYTRRPGWEHGTLDRLPGAQAGRRRLYLWADGTLQPRPPGRPDTHANVNNVVLRPQYTLREAILDDLAGVADALTTEVVSFDGEPLAAAVEMLGAPLVRLHVLANRAAYQVHVRLLAVAPDGEASLISHGHFGTRQGLPGQHATLEIECRTIAYRLPAGHRLRLLVSNCDPEYVFPVFEPFCVRVYHEGSRPSALVLPVVDA